MKRLALSFFLIFVAFASVTAQTIVSAGSGAWNAPGTWVGGVVPDFSNSTQIRIQNNHVVNVPSGYSVQVDQLQVRVGGQLIIDNGGLLDVVNASGNDLSIFTGAPSGQMTVNGTLELSPAATIVNFDGVSNTPTNSSTVIVGASGIYRHKYTTTSGTILGATWQTGSTAEVTGYTTNTNRPANLSQTFYNFTWNCPSQTGIIDLRGNLNNVNGNLTIESTGGTTKGILRWSYADSNMTCNIGGDLIISGLSGVWFTGTGVNNVINIGGDFIVNSAVDQLLARDGNITINCTDLSLTNAAGSLTMTTTTAASATINVDGNFDVASALNAGMGTAAVNFSGASPAVQLISGSGTIGRINFAINSGAIVDVGVNSIRGTGTFTMDAGSELRVGDLNASGAIQNSTTVGNIRVPVASRTYSPQATLNYNGAGAQAIGAGHPVVNTVVSTNTSLFTNNLTVSSITLLSGNLSAGNRTLNVNGDWTVNGGFFAHGSGNVVFSGTSVIQGSGPFGFNTFNVGATGNVTLPPANLSVTANFTLNPASILNAGSGTVVFNGGIGQTINANGKTLHNILINKTAGDVSLGNALLLRGTLTIQSSTTFRTNGLLTLISTNDNPAQDASIAQLPASASVVGNVTVQRYMSPADNYDRFISMPVSNATVAQLQDDFSVTGDFVGTSYPCTGCNNDGPSLKKYLETLTGDFSNGYKQVPDIGGTPSQILQVGVGYDAYMWNAVAPIVLDVTGPINRGTVNFAVSHTASTPATPAADGWNLIGNPYPSAIQWSNGAGWNKSNIDPTVWVWDVVGRVWRTYNANTQTGNLTNGIIALGQAFWVKVPTAAAASLSVNEQAKSTAGSGSYLRTRTGPSVPTLTISLRRGGFSDEAFVYLQDSATSEFDARFDSPKLELGIERMHVSAVKSEAHLGHAAVSGGFDYAIPVRVVAEEEGQFELSIDTSSDFPDLKSYFVYDALSRERVAIKGSRIKFTYSKSDPENRFFIMRGESIQQKQDELSIQIYPNPTTDQVSVKILGTIVHKLELISSAGMLVSSVDGLEADGNAYTATLSLMHQPGGVYFLMLRTENGLIVKRIVKL